MLYFLANWFNNPLKYTDPSGYLSTAYYMDGVRVESYEVPISAKGSGSDFRNGNVSFTQYSYQTKDGYVSSWSRQAIWAYYDKSDAPLYVNRFPRMNDESGGFYGNSYVSRNSEVTIRPEGTNLTGSDGDNWLSNAGKVIVMGMMWASGYRLPFGTGTYYKNDEVAGAMRNAWQVNNARQAFYNKYKGVSDLKGASYTNHKGVFGLQGLFRAGIDPIEQFIGSYRVDIHAQGEILQFTLTNNTSFESFLYGIGNSWNGGPMGNFRQTYIFTEPIKR